MVFQISYGSKKALENLGQNADLLGLTNFEVNNQAINPNKNNYAYIGESVDVIDGAWKKKPTVPKTTAGSIVANLAPGPPSVNDAADPVGWLTGSTIGGVAIVFIVALIILL